MCATIFNHIQPYSNVLIFFHPPTHLVIDDVDHVDFCLPRFFVAREPGWFVDCDAVAVHICGDCLRVQSKSHV